MDNRTVLAVDLGKTGCRVAIWSGGGRLTAEGMGAPGLAAADGVALTEAAILAVAKPLLDAAGAGQVDAIGVGAAGALTAPDAARALARRLYAALPTRMTAVASDATTSHAGALGGDPGVVLAAGTGAVAIAVGPDGVQRRVDGWGPWLGDEGGGAWLGMQGLRAALRMADGRGPPTALALAAERRFGPIPGLAALIEGAANPPRLAASFAGDIAGAAQAGDAVAVGLLRDAAATLARTVAAAAACLAGHGPVRFAMVGGLLALGPSLTEPLLADLRAAAPRLVPVPAAGTALDGARLLATDCGAIHEPAVMREGPCPSTPSGARL